MPELKGVELIEHTENKAKSGELLTMREWQLLNLCTCSSVRDRYFPKYCEKHGVGSDAKLSNTVWQLIWNAALDQHEEEHIDFLKGVYGKHWQPPAHYRLKKLTEAFLKDTSKLF